MYGCAHSGAPPCAMYTGAPGAVSHLQSGGKLRSAIQAPEDHSGHMQHVCGQYVRGLGHGIQHLVLQALNARHIDALLLRPFKGLQRHLQSKEEPRLRGGVLYLLFSAPLSQLAKTPRNTGAVMQHQLIVWKPLAPSYTIFRKLSAAPPDAAQPQILELPSPGGVGGSLGRTTLALPYRAALHAHKLYQPFHTRL